MRCIILGASTNPDHGFSAACVADGDMVICADGGYLLAKKAGVMPDLVVGDFDSAPLPPDAIPVKRVKAEKDDTDTFLALSEGIAAGCSEFVFYGCLGGRAEHTFANLTILKYLCVRGMKGELRDAHTSMTMIRDRLSLKRGDRPQYISVFPYGEAAAGVTLRGMKYLLTDKTLTNEITLGVSNEFAEDEASITLISGTLLVVVSDM